MDRLVLHLVLYCSMMLILYSLPPLVPLRWVAVLLDSDGLLHQQVQKYIEIRNPFHQMVYCYQMEENALESHTGGNRGILKTRDH